MRVCLDAGQGVHLAEHGAEGGAGPRRDADAPGGAG
jgi:hypothetical protein